MGCCNVQLFATILAALKNSTMTSFKENHKGLYILSGVKGSITYCRENNNVEWMGILLLLYNEELLQLDVGRKIK